MHFRTLYPQKWCVCAHPLQYIMLSAEIYIKQNRESFNKYHKSDVFSFPPSPLTPFQVGLCLKSKVWLSNINVLTQFNVIKQSVKKKIVPLASNSLLEVAHHFHIDIIFLTSSKIVYHYKHISLLPPIITLYQQYQQCVMSRNMKICLMIT